MRNSKHKKRVLVTGGHLTPAIAAIEELHRRGDWEVMFIGRSTAQEGSDILAREMHEIPKLGVKLVTIPAGKLPRKLNRLALRAILRIPLGFLASYMKVKRFKPDVILSFGGYVALPVALSGKLLGIPIVTHEQSVHGGLANTLIAHFATVMAVSWVESGEHFKKEVVITGNPLRDAIVKGIRKSLEIQTGDRPLLYITGGNQGAHAINSVTGIVLRRLLKRFIIIHQCGMTKNGSDLKQLLKARSSFPNSLRRRYLVKDWFSTEEVAWILNRADLVISRSGANVVSELAFTGVKAILIPLPHARRNEQLNNANLLKQAGTAEIILEENLSPASLLQTINAMLSDAQKYHKQAEVAKRLVIPDAAQRLVDVVQNVYEKTVY
jgi:UDP-N-acetylglucosamine--N-acetylmuramyl-(pentapeptide) pyrophosphoryl-undecaprenol N-acetylglucosamine transferase